jgi:hypothetical protein
MMNPGALLFVLTGCLAASWELDLGGQGVWQVFSPTNDTIPLCTDTIVPGSIHDDLERCGQIGDPLYR